MAIMFEFYESPDPTGDNPGKYHARPIITRTITTEQLATEIEEASSLTKGDVRAVLSALSNSIAKHLGDSERVHLEGIGYFRPTLKYTREIDPKKTRAQSILFKAVNFKADKLLNRKLIMAPTERAEFKIHSVSITPDKVDEKVKKFLSEHPYITRTDIQKLCGLTRSTAIRQIKRMINEEKLINVRTQRQPLYVWQNEKQK